MWMIRRTLVLAALAVACARSGGPDTAPSSSSSPSAGLPTPTPAQISTPPATGHCAAEPGSCRPADVASSPEGEDFLRPARVLFRIAACGPSGELPTRFDPALVLRHCDELAHVYDEYRKIWVEVAKAFFASHRPRDLPDDVVYPFGGGDLASALATFPAATEITTISLEPAGDVRLVDALSQDRLGPELSLHRSRIERLFGEAYSRTDNLEKESTAALPGEILFALAALVAYRDEPVGLRYFRLQQDGSVAAAEDAQATRKLFDNAELRFRPIGDSTRPIHVLRHIAHNLDDDHLAASPLLAHLNGKRKVLAMTKAASHLLWKDHFALIRGWLLEHTDWMVSDSSGIPPRFARPAGFSQDTYGKYEGPGPWGLPDGPDGLDFKRLFASGPVRELGFRYGYPDKNGHANLIVTRR
jgi:hypothetical protein